MGVHERLTGAQRTAKYRAAKRAQGLKLKQIWLPNLSHPDVRARIKREVAAINASKEEAEYNRWLDHNYDELMADEPPYDWGGKEPQ